MNPVIIQSVVFALIGISIATVVCVLLASFFMRHKRAYFFGLLAALLAYITVLIIATAFNVAAFVPPVLLIMVAVPCIVEESFRLLCADHIRASLSDRTNWLSFAFGYALLESLAKLMDYAVLYSRGQVGVELLLMPIVPLTLHVFLGVAVCFMLWRNVHPVLVFLIAASVHGAHNFSVVSADVQIGDIGVFVALRAGAFVLLTLVIFWIASRLKPVTTPPPSANTAS